MKIKALSFWQRKFIWDCTMALLIVVVPFFVYFHLYFDNEACYINFFGFYYDHRSVSNRFFVFNILIKSVQILILIVWFFNSVNWWRYFVLFYNIIWVTSLARTFFYPEFIENHLNLFLIFVNLGVVLFVLYLDFYSFKSVGKIHISRPVFTYLALKKRDLLQSFSSNEKSMIKLKGDFKEAQHIRGLFSLRENLFGVLKLLRLKTNRKTTFQKFDFIIISSLVFCVFMFYAFRLVPHGLNNYNYGALEITSYGFTDLRVFLWYIRFKFCVIIPCCLWFITCQHWWRYAILSPIILSVLQLWEVFQDNSDVADEVEFLSALPSVLLIILVLLVFARLVNYQTKLLDLNDKITSEIETVIDTLHDSKNVQDKKKRLIALKRSKKTGAKDENLKSLIALQQEIRAALETKD